MPLCTDHLLCHLECNEPFHKFHPHASKMNCNCIPDEIDVDYDIDCDNQKKINKNYNKYVKSEEITKINTVNGNRIEEYVYNQDFKEKVKEKKTGKRKSKWMCWK